jgi:hypothetical protein
MIKSDLQKMGLTIKLKIIIKVFIQKVYFFFVNASHPYYFPKEVQIMASKYNKKTNKKNFSKNMNEIFIQNKIYNKIKNYQIITLIYPYKLQVLF